MEDVLNQPLTLIKPLMNAAGMLGFVPDLRLPLDWESFGAFVTNPVSAGPRQPASGTRWELIPGGALLHSGHPNPGFRQLLRHAADAWAQSPVPVIVHLLSGDPYFLADAVVRLETLENILAVEIGIDEYSTGEEIRLAVEAALGELPVIVRLPLGRVSDLAETCVRDGAAAVSLGPPRGMISQNGQFSSGRVYGPALFPQALQAVRQMDQSGIQVIGAGGVTSRDDLQAMLAAGALGVQIDLAVWRGDWFQSEGD
jgi:dihydroorotate dehydrogenase